MKIIGKIISTDGSSKNNATTATPFTLPQKFLFQPSVDCYVNQGNSTVAATDGIKVLGDSLIPIDLNADTHFACIPVTGTALTGKCGVL